MKALIVAVVASLALGSMIFAGEPLESRLMHLIDRNRVATNTPLTYRVSVAYDINRREPLRYDYGVVHLIPTR